MAIMVFENLLASLLLYEFFRVADDIPMPLGQEPG